MKRWVEEMNKNKKMIWIMIVIYIFNYDVISMYFNWNEEWIRDKFNKLNGLGNRYIRVYCECLVDYMMVRIKIIVYIYF